MKARYRNTSFFHKQAKARQSLNHISQICTSTGEIVKGREQVILAAREHFRNLFTEEGEVEEEITKDFLDHIPPLINQAENVNLLKPFSESEIINVIWAMDPDKAPFPDGFTTNFYRACCPVIKET